MERTTLTRNLRPLLLKGLAVRRSEGRKGARVPELTAAGEERLTAALPLWAATQAQVMAQITDADWQHTQHLLGC